MARRDGSDDFWLGSTLRISVAEQVAVLQALHQGRLGVSRRALDALAEASADGQFGGSTLSGKTGSGPVQPGRAGSAFEGWYVGAVAGRGTAQAIFALYCRAPRHAALRDFRKAFAVSLLQDGGLLPR